MRKFQALFAVVVMSLFTASASAAPIGYWRLEGGPVGTEASLVSSTVNSAILQGTEGGTGTASMFYSSDVPGAYIQDGVSGPFVANSKSLYTERVGNNRFDVDDNISGTPLHEPTSFTFETFVKADLADISSFRVIARKTRNSSDGSWFLFANNGNLILRADTQVSGSSGPGFNQSISSNFSVHGSIDDGAWHHIAVTYDENTSLFQLFKDYSLIGTLNPDDSGANQIVYDGGVLHIGGRSNGNGLQGWIDEPRLSDGVLTVDQFLRTGIPPQPIPEPSSMLLLAVGGLMLMSRRKLLYRNHIE